MDNKQLIKILNKTIKDLKKDNGYYKHRYKVHKELKIHYKELYKTAVGELQFSNLQKEHYKSMIDEVEILLDKGVKPHLIKQVIKNGKERAVIDLSIHTDLIFR